MAYDISISRNQPFTDEFEPISLEEWQSVIKQMNSLTPISELRTENPMTGEIIQIKLENAAAYVTNHNNESDKTIIRYDTDGYLKFKYIDDNHIETVKAIAKRISAELYGEEGEQY